MQLYPAIDLRGGRCVRLAQGDFARETTYADDPAEQARRFAAGGAAWIHVVDLDAARTGEAVNLRQLAAICAAVDVPVQTGGGVRSAADAQRRFDAGAARVIVGSAAVSDPEVVDELAARHPGAVAVGLDVRGRTVATHGWERAAAERLADLVARFERSGAGALVVTQVEADGMLGGPDLALYRELLAATAVPLVASGGVGSLDDLAKLASLGESGRRLAGVIAGKAIYEGRFTVAEGVAACRASV